MAFGAECADFCVGTLCAVQRRAAAYVPRLDQRTANLFPSHPWSIVPTAVKEEMPAIAATAGEEVTLEAQPWVPFRMMAPATQARWS
mmetsp:Transcript_51063/g.148647  ORF Transcript_51063/g.148647 Transcript_51063/m.148647 type:complete len:87 (+) Transcript_51063:1079-1339(+)